MSLVLFLAAAVLGPTQDAQVRVTYKTVAVPLSRALEELSKATGANLKASPTTENDIVILAVKDVPLEDVKARLAKAITGQWTKDAAGVEYLGIDPSGRAAEARTELTKRTEAIATALKNLQAFLDPRKPGTQTEPSEGLGPGFSTDGSADTRLIAQLSFALRAQDIAAIPLGSRVVYSTSPNSMQRPIAVAGLAKFVSDFAVQHNKEVEMAKSSTDGIDPAQAEKMAAMKKLWGNFYSEPKRIESPPAKLLLVVENGSSLGFGTDAVELKMVAFDAKGESCASSSFPLFSDRDAMMAQDVSSPDVPAEGKPGQAQPEPKKSDPKLDKPIEYSALTKELTSLMDFRTMGTSDKKPSVELLERLMRPDQYDPLSYEYSESLLALIDAEGLNFVASVPDDSIELSSMVRSGTKNTLATFKDSLSTSQSADFEEKDGWASLKSKSPASARNKRVDRKALGQLLQSASKTIVPSLDSLANYAAVNPPIMETPVAMYSVMLVAPNAMSMGLRGLQDWPMLRLYGLLGQGERTSLRQGQTIPFAAVGAKALPVLRQMVYGVGGRFQVGPEPNEEQLGLLSMASSFRSQVVTSFKEEPTELLPNGLPTLGGLTLNVKPSHFVMIDAKGFMASMFGAMGAEEYAMLKYFAEEPKLAAVSGMMPKLDKFKVGDRDILDFRLHLAPDVTQKHTLMDQRISKDAASVGVDGLPSDFMADVTKQLKLYKDGLPFSFGSEMFGDGRPPTY